jgi:hypothetical protein
MPKMAHPPIPTTKLQLARNLNLAGGAKASIWVGAPLLRKARESDVLSFLTDYRGIRSGLRAGDTLVFSLAGQAGTGAGRLVVTADLTLQNTLDAMTQFFQGKEWHLGGKPQAIWLEGATEPTLAAHLRVVNETGAWWNVTMDLKQPHWFALDTSQLFRNSESHSPTVLPSAFSVFYPASDEDVLVELQDSQGNPIRLQEGMVLQFSAVHSSAGKESEAVGDSPVTIV